MRKKRRTARVSGAPALGLGRPLPDIEAETIGLRVDLPQPAPDGRENTAPGEAVGQPHRPVEKRVALVAKVA